MIAFVALLALAGADALHGLTAAHPAFAQAATSDIVDSAAAVNQQIGLTSESLPAYVGRIINYVLGLLGIVLLLLFLYAGYLFLTSGGSAEKVEKAKKLMVSAVIGIVIIFAAYSIASFVIKMLLGDVGGGGSSGSSATAQLYSSTRGRSALGNGLIDYHYPEAGQTNVARNTKIAVTFKRPLVLSTVLKGYDDRGTYGTNDDRVLVGGAWQDVAALPADQRVFDLNTDAIRLIAHDNLGTADGSTVDAQFDSTYPVAAGGSAGAVTGFKVRVTDVPAVYDAKVEQTITFKPNDYLGSASTDMNYRVALRGGEGSQAVKVWDKPARPLAAGENPPVKPALPQAYANGGYYWNFTTGTVADLTPPRLVSVYPSAVANPANAPVFRNQLLQAYFDEAMDPTSASGSAARGYDLMGVEANTGAHGAYERVAGEFVIGNRYRTVEFVPSGACDTAAGTVAVNSCGDAVTCLPGNADLRLYGLAASVSVTDPASRPAAAFDNGLEDMAGNSFDGNNNGKAEGPELSSVQTDGRSGRYDLNNSLNKAMEGVSDTAQWRYHTNDTVDLTAPVVTQADPPPVAADYPAGYNLIPSELTPSFTWSKVISVSSIRTGGFDETTNDFSDDDSTVVLRSKEMEKQSGSPACPGSGGDVCRTQRLDPPSFYVETELATSPSPHSSLYLRHPSRSFYRANDLGFTADEVRAYPSAVPVYVPIARARLRDTLQNCFYPSYYKPTAGSSECSAGATGQTSCCSTEASSDDTFTTKCNP